MGSNIPSNVIFCSLLVNKTVVFRLLIFLKGEENQPAALTSCFVSSFMGLKMLWRKFLRCLFVSVRDGRGQSSVRVASEPPRWCRGIEAGRVLEDFRKT